MSALLLDFGGVVTKTLFETHDASERALGLPPGALDWRGPFAPETDALWRRMQAGEIAERDYWLQRARQVGALVGQRWTRMEDLLRAVRGAEPMAAIRPEALHAFDRARAAGAKLGILSNELDLFYGPEFRAGLPFLDDFHAVIDATHTGVLKPDPRAYAMAAEALGEDPGAIVFVDDQPRNVEGARRAGLRAVRFDVRAPGEGFAAALDLLTPREHRHAP